MKQEPARENCETFKEEISKLGFEMLDDKRTKVIEKIKMEAIKAIHQSAEKTKVNFSTYLVERLLITQFTFF